MARTVVWSCAIFCRKRLRIKNLKHNFPWKQHRARLEIQRVADPPPPPHIGSYIPHFRCDELHSMPGGGGRECRIQYT